MHADGWKMPACPVNGPSVGAWGPAVAVAWYTAPGEKPVLRLARSKDGGNTFDAPVDVDQGAALQGRVDVAKDGDATWLVWLREDAKGQSVQLARYPQPGRRTRRRPSWPRSPGAAAGPGSRRSPSATAWPSWCGPTSSMAARTWPAPRSHRAVEPAPVVRRKSVTRTPQ